MASFDEERLKDEEGIDGIVVADKKVWIECSVSGFPLVVGWPAEVWSGLSNNRKTEAGSLSQWTSGTGQAELQGGLDHYGQSDMRWRRCVCANRGRWCCRRREEGKGRKIGSRIGTWVVVGRIGLGKKEDEPAAEAKRSDGGKEAVGPSHLLAEQAERAGERFDADRQTGSCLMQAASATVEGLSFVVVGVAELFPGKSRGRAARDPREERKSGDVVRLCYDETDIFQPELLLGGGLGIWEEGMRILWRWPSTVCNSNGILGKRPPARCEPHASTSKGRGCSGREGGVPGTSGSNCQFAAAAGATREWKAGLQQQQVEAGAGGREGGTGQVLDPGGLLQCLVGCPGSLTAPKKGAAADWWTQRDVFPILAPALRATRRFGRRLSGRFRTTQGPLKAVVTRKAHCPEGRSREGGAACATAVVANEDAWGFCTTSFEARDWMDGMSGIGTEL
ncbi:hypothetical protein K456DRAFT_1927387 [Colletotrichum gloeosporioides 23]|nr:hypothetical protein K456DRAFT_1927387 [Colletotrichum gloeosporioides 23]